MIPADISHRLPGRIRIRGNGLCGQDATLQRIERDLAALPGIRRVSVNSITGSLLLEYDVALLSESQLIEHLSSRHEIRIADSENANDVPDIGKRDERTSANLANAVEYPFARADRALLDITDGYLDLRNTVPMAFLLMGTWKVLSTSALPAIPWFTYYWMSFRLFTIFRERNEKARATGYGATNNDAMVTKNASSEKFVGCFRNG